MEQDPVAVLPGNPALDALPAAVAPHLVLAEGARDALRRQGVRAVHQLEVEMGSRRVARVPDPSEHIADPHLLAGLDRHGAGRQMGEPGVDVPAA